MTRRRGRAPLALVAFAFAVVTLGTTLPTPIYPIYESRYGISTSAVTVIFAVYAIAVVGALLLFGGLSDVVGRKRVLVPGLVLSGLSAAVFLAARGTPELYVGRVLSGLSAGMFAGTATAMVVDLAPGGRRELGSAIAVAVNLGGLGLGSLVSGALDEWVPDPTRVPFIVDLGLVALALVAMMLAPETVRPRAGARLRVQRLHVPREIRGLFWQASIAGFCGFAVSGLFGAVAPSVMAQLLGVHSHALAGLVVALIFATSVAGQVATQRIANQRALVAGCAGLLAGLALLAAALLAESLALLVLSALVSGAGQGLAVGGGLASVNQGVTPARRGEVASTYFVVTYSGLVIPVVGDGLAVSVAGLRTAGLLFTAIVGAAVLVVVATLFGRRRAT